MNCRLKHKKYVITISYGDYTIGGGGTDKYLLSQQRLFNEHGISVLHIYPREKVFKRTVGSRRVWSVLCDGDLVGICDVYGISNLILKEQIKGVFLLGIIIHHMKNTSLKEVIKVLELTEVPVYFYLHDYYTVCPSAGLIKDKREFCGVSFPNNNKCINCSCFDNTLIEDTVLIKDIFRIIKDRVTFIAPSKSVSDNWSLAYPDYMGSVVILPHQTLLGSYYGNMDVINDNEPLKIAYVGYQALHKGWKEWIDAAKTAKDNGNNYCFYQIGRCSETYDFISQIHVDFQTDINAMTKALRDNSIDCAVLWSVWPETYSFTLFEACSANCFILTNSMSGNIAAVVNERENGIVAKDRSDLIELMLDEKLLREKINSFRMKKLYGPESLEENDAIISLIESNKIEYSVREVKYSLSEPMLSLLFDIYSLAIRIKRLLLGLKS